MDIDGADLILDFDADPPVEVVEALRRHKAGILAHLRSGVVEWSAADWRAFFNERAGVGEFDGGMTRADAEAVAFEACVVEWLNRQLLPSPAGECAWCGRRESKGATVLPFGVSRHAWLHPACWPSWHAERRRAAVAALEGFGIPHSKTASAGDTVRP